MKIFVKAILAGVYITIAAVVFLLVCGYTETILGKVVAGLLFSIALLVIVVKDYYLYTGKVGYLLPYQRNIPKMILITILGNVVAILVMGLLINLSNISNLNEFAIQTVTKKFDTTWYQALISSFFCGILMYTAVDGYNKSKDNLSKVLIVNLSVIVFLTIGFDHSIANIAYLVLAKQISFKIVFLLIMMIIGNGLGGVFINILHEKIEKLNIK